MNHGINQKEVCTSGHPSNTSLITPRAVAMERDTPLVCASGFPAGWLEQLPTPTRRLLVNQQLGVLWHHQPHTQDPVCHNQICLGPSPGPPIERFCVGSRRGGEYCQHGPWASTVVSRQLPTIATSLPDATHGAVMIAALPPVLSPTLASAHVRAFGSNLRCSPHPHQ